MNAMNPLDSDRDTLYASFDAVTEMRNPVLWADVPDPDVIRVGEEFYMVSTTMHLMPGGPIMCSKDLANWQPVSYLFDSLTDSPKYNMIGGTVYGRGQWATSLRYHNGKFYAMFAPNDNVGGNTYIYTTEDPAKGWKLLSRMRHFHDSSFLFDDDGRVYVFHDTGCITELRSDLKGVLKGGLDTCVICRDAEENGLLEGSRVIKHNGKYYWLMVSWPKNKPRRQVCFRADHICGPWEKKVILQDNFAGFPYAGQGTIVDDQKGNWYGVVFQDRGAVGRVLTVEPCHWIGGWPMLGDTNGKIPFIMKKAVPGQPYHPFVVSDEFDEGKTCHPVLDIHWQWNHNPVNSAWSLTDRPGCLRLKTCRIVDNLFAAPNTISQRMEGPGCSAIVKLDISHLKDGDCAGFSAFNGDAAVLTVSREGKQLMLRRTDESVMLSDQDKKIESVDRRELGFVRLKVPVIYLRIDADFRLHTDKARLFYSLDNKNWIPIGEVFQMKYDYRRLFMGTRYAIFCYATKCLGGYVDVDWFHYFRQRQGE
jgi:beta-xylosidase